MKINKFAILIIIVLIISNLAVSNLIAGGFGAAGISGFLLLSLLLLLFSTFILSVIKKQYKHSLLYLSLGLAFISLEFFVRNKIVLAKLESSKSNGEIVLKALNEYYKDNHQKPNSVHSLAPKYLTKIPKPGFLLSQYYLYGDSGIGFNAPAFILYEKQFGGTWRSHD
jgi:hypothetical protein